MNLQEIIIAINNSQLGVEFDEIMHLRNQTSMLETYGKLRSETCHSTFLKWLFENDNLNSQHMHGAVYRLITLIQKWGAIQSTTGFPTVGKKSFSKLFINRLIIDNVTREYPIKTNTYGPGKIDLVIECTINIGLKKNYKLNIVIENKVDAKETTKIINGNLLYQTDAYVDYFNNSKPNDINVFIFLTPMSTKELFYVKASTSINSDRYVRLNYQELYDNIIYPLYSLSTITDENKYKLGDYIKAISKPSQNNVKNKSALVMTQKEKNLLIEYFDNNKELIMEAIYAKSFDKKENSRQSFADAYETLGGVASSSNTFSVNGKDVGVMWKVVAKFAEMLLSQGCSPSNIENEIRALVGTPKTTVKYFDITDQYFNTYPNGKYRCHNFSDNSGNIYYISDQWYGNGNFAEFVKQVNAKYPAFQIS